MKFGSLKIKLLNGQTREFGLDQPTLSIGRASGNDLIIEDTSVSRRHARLSVESGRLMIEDLGSANGTFIGSQRLAANAASLVPEDQVLRLGDVEIKYNAPPPVEAQQAFAPVEVKPATSLPSGPPVSLSLVGPTQPVAPGSTTIASLTVQNRGQVVDELIIQVVGVPVDWVRFSKERVSLLPQAQETVTITFAPPRRSEATAGDHVVTITVTSREQHSVVDASATLKVLPYQDFALNLQPQRARRDFQLLVQNQGNAPTAYRFSGSDDEQSLVYQFGQTGVSLQPGQSGTIALRVAPKVQPKVGTRETRAFTIKAAPLDSPGADAKVAGQLIIRPPIPVWLIPLMLALAVVACVLVTTVYGQVCGLLGTNLPLCPSNAKPTISVFEVTPNEIEKGGTIVLTWDVSSADQVELTQPAPETLPGKRGTKTYTIDQSTTYALHAKNAFGSVDQSITVNLKNSPPVIQSFKADPAVVTAGRSDKIALSWIVAGAEAVSIEGVPGASGPTGSVQIDPPPGDKTFNLVATNATGTVHQDLTVRVSSAGCVLQSATTMREGPSDKYEVVDSLAAGTSVMPVGRNATGVWLRVQANREGWVPANAIGCSSLNILDIATVNPADIPPEPTATPTPTPVPTPTRKPTDAPAPVNPAAPQPSSPAGTSGLKQVFSGGNGVIYTINDNGELLWYRHDGQGDGSYTWAANNGSKVGIGWNFKQVFSGGDGVIYAINDNGDLLWYRHDGWADGSSTWAANSGSKVGVGWNFKQVFSGGDGVIYVIKDNGDLLWYRHDEWRDGGATWAANIGSKVGVGWNFKQVFSGGDGVIYVIKDNGDLLWYRHDGWRDGGDAWAPNIGSKVGDGWTVKQVFSGGNGVIYAIMDNGELRWYRHDGRADGSYTWADNNGSKVGDGWIVK